jgi:cell division protein ZapA
MEQIEARILDRDYKLAVNPDEKDQLIDAVKIVDGRMRNIRESGRVSGVDRIAVMAALQLAHELIGSQSDAATRPSGDIAKRIRKMSEDIEAEIKRQESLF